MSEKDCQKDTRNETNTSLDRDYETENRRHKERIKKLDRLFAYMIHPSCLFAAVGVYLILFFSVWLFGVYSEIPAVKELTDGMQIIACGLTVALVARVLCYAVLV